MACSYQEHGASHMVELTVNGKVTQADMETLIPKMEAFIKDHAQDGHKVKIIEVIEDFAGFEWATLTPGMRFDFQHMKDFSHAAVVTDEGWIGPITRLLAPLMSIEVRVFPMSRLGEARQWIADA